MGDMLIRGLSEAAIASIDADATARGMSRQEYLRQRFEAEGAVASTDRPRLTVEDLRRAASAAVDLDDSGVMEDAWR